MGPCVSPGCPLTQHCPKLPRVSSAQVLQSLLCNSKSPVVYSGPILLEQAADTCKKACRSPSKNGSLTKAAENGVAVWRKITYQKKKKKTGMRD